MEKKTVDALRVMLCGELDDIAKEGKLTHESLDIVKDLLESMKALAKIEKMEEEKEAMSMDMKGYSQRTIGRYYVDGEYGTGNSYGGRSMYDMGQGNPYRGGNGNSYAGRGNYDMGNSYRYYSPMYDYPMYSMRGGYSRTGSKSEVMEELMDLMKETQDESVKSAISEAINMMNQ